MHHVQYYYPVCRPEVATRQQHNHQYRQCEVRGGSPIHQIVYKPNVWGQTFLEFFLLIFQEIKIRKESAKQRERKKEPAGHISQASPVSE